MTTFAKSFIIGWVNLIVFPIVLGVLSALSLWEHLTTYFLLSAGGLEVYIILMARHMVYGPEVGEWLDLSGIREDFRDLLTETTQRGRYINKAILQAFPPEKKLSMADSHNLVTDSVRLTMQAERPYIQKLDKLGLIHTPNTAYEKEYVLTEKGKWVKELVRLYFPERYLTYVLRNELGLRKISPPPQNPDNV